MAVLPTHNKDVKKKIRPPTFQHLLKNRGDLVLFFCSIFLTHYVYFEATKLKNKWVEEKKLKGRWRAQKRKEGMATISYYKGLHRRGQL